MEKKLSLHYLQYLVFATAGVFVLVLLNIMRGNRLEQFLIIMLFTVFYVFWGIAHHITDKTLRPKIVLEYILIGAIVLFMLQVLLS